MSDNTNEPFVPTHLSKAELLERVHRSWAELERSIAQLSDAQLSLPVLSEGWAIKDMLAHLASWERRCTDWIATSLRGETPQRPEPGVTWDDIDQLNERTFLENRQRSSQEIIAASNATHRRFLEQIQFLSEEDLNNPQRFPWTGGEALVWFIGSNSYEHYKDHSLCT
ncbi:MAG: ClbS/DfsB family four-helix bundle protein [Chloroflexota bacterium]|nr:ClbS/DfsB family four-helix bundle protein [Chloroflexota bacterium]